MSSQWGQPAMTVPSSAAEWQELKAPDGRSYYFNSRLNQTTWEKPEVLKTPEEIRLANIPWKEYKIPDGRTYWNNSQTGESVWTIPEAYKEALEGPAKTNGYSALATASKCSSTSMALTLQTFIPAQREVEEESTPGTEAYHNKEEAKRDFIRLLRKTDIDPTSEWNEVLPLIIKNPAFRAVPNPVERKQLFDTFLETLRTEVDEKEKDRRHRVREAFLAMCRRHHEIHHYTRFKTAKPILQEETDWKAAKDDDERRELFEEYRVEALRVVVEQENSERDKARRKFREILESLELEPYARWRQTRDRFDSKIREEGRQEELAAMHDIDYLLVFEEYVKELEKKFNDVRQEERDSKFRRERQNREAFNELLQELVREGIIIETAKWKEIFPLIKDDERFLNIVGQAGSTPLELFWDLLESLETEFRLKRDYVFEVLEDKRYEVTESTKYDEFKTLMSSDPRTSVIPNDLLERIFQNLVSKARRYASSKQSRKKSDAFRSLLRHMPEVTYDSSWEEIRPLMVDKEEFKDLESEEERVIAFDKVIRRLNEKRDEEKRYREREGSARKRDHEESPHRDREGSVRKRDRDESRHRRDSKNRKRYEDDERSRERSRPSEPSRDRRDRDRDYRDRRDDDPRRARPSKRRSSDDLRPADRKRRKEGLDYGEKEDGEVSEEGEIPD